MNSRDRVPLTLVVGLLLVAAVAALIAPFVFANPGPAEPVPDTAEAPARPPVENAPTAPSEREARVRMVGTVRGEAFTQGVPDRVVAR